MLYLWGDGLKVILYFSKVQDHAYDRNLKQIEHYFDMQCANSGHTS